MSMAEKLAVVIHDLIMQERHGCATVAEAGGYIDLAVAIRNQPAPVPALKNMHCFLCAEGVRCMNCNEPVVVGKCVGMEP